MPKKFRPAVDLMAFKCRTLKVKQTHLVGNDDDDDSKPTLIGK
jgi:hypothetical protein